MELPDPKPTEVATAYARPAGALLVVAGLVHLLVPRLSTRIVAWSYDRLLDVEFVPGEGTTKRVRAIGLAMLAAGGHLLYHGGIVPGREA
jgi:uncharacterized protein YjeT (DUF2065 family)